MCNGPGNCRCERPCSDSFSAHYKYIQNISDTQTGRMALIKKSKSNKHIEDAIQILEKEKEALELRIQNINKAIRTLEDETSKEV